MIYNNRIHRFILGNVEGKSAEELANLTNENFGTQFTKYSMKSYKSNYGLKSNTRGGNPAGESKVFPKEVAEFIKNNALGIGNAELAELVNKTFNIVYSRQQIKTYKHNHKISSGLDGRFLPGTIPPNKGKKMPKELYEKCSKTMFKKGNTPQNHKPVGSERIDSKDGFVLIKVSEPSKWRLKHVVLWEKHNGPVPKGHKIVFLDSNRQNIVIENLVIVTDAEMLVVNRSNLKSQYPELTKIGIAVAKTKCAIRKIKKNRKNEVQK